jgi:hypothetical protein
MPAKFEMYAALREMGAQYLRKDLRDDWSPENPTRNYCYVIAEFVYWYLAPKGSQAMELKLPGEAAPHRFVKTPDNVIIDLARWQFDFKLPYDNAKPKMFMQTGGVGPSKRAQILAAKLGFVVTSWKNRLTAASSTDKLVPIQPSTSSKRSNQAMATEVLTGSYKGHVLTGTPEGEKGFIIKTWVGPEGSPVAQKVSKGIVGTSFKTVSAAGVAVFGRMNQLFGYPSSVEGRHLKFSASNGSAAKVRKTATKTAKGAVEDKSRKSAAEDKTPTTRNSRRNGPVTTRKATKAEVKTTAKRGRPAKTAAVSSKSRKRSSTDDEGIGEVEF